MLGYNSIKTTKKFSIRERKMGSISYLYRLPERANLITVTYVPFYTTAIHYFLYDSASINELIITFMVCSLLTSIALLYVLKKYSLNIYDNYFETPKRRYSPSDIRILKIYRRYGLVTFKTHDSLSTKRIRFLKQNRSVAIGEMIDWATRNHVEIKYINR